MLATFGSWFAQRGGEIHAAVKMVYRPGAGWALEADGEIPSGERLVYLPTALMLGCGKDGMSEPLRQVTETIPDEFWSSRLGLVLLRERVAGNTAVRTVHKFITVCARGLTDVLSTGYHS